ncbi:DUF6867 family protein [Polycladidibacter hongkongensis]|uniref:DUF6867 family protein n=1 Tax=Polycladidibacter hongkongensis TaxID=1647556 RepID=UPI00083762BE|nr:hypothetical protein [Pseudovibrio hongkongensis]
MGILYPSSALVFFFMVLVFGGLAAIATGRAVAVTWRPLPVLFWFVFLLTLAVRFLCFALFGEPLTSLYYLLVDYGVLAAIGYGGFRMARARQMVIQYSWLYQPAGPFSWRLKPGQDDSY